MWTLALNHSHFLVPAHLALAQALVLALAQLSAFSTEQRDHSVFSRTVSLFLQLAFRNNMKFLDSFSVFLENGDSFGLEK